MASTFSNLKFELIGTGDQSGTWGTTTNTNLGTAIEQALVGMATISSGFVTNSLTLTLTDTNAAQNARALVLNLTQALSGAGTLNVPAIQKPYMIINATGQTVTVKVTGLTGVAVPNGTRAFLYNNGTDVGDFFNYASSLTLGTALPITSGGTGTTSTTFVNLATNVTGTLPVANGGTGGATQAAARTGIGATTVGSNFFTLTNPSAITFPRMNADNTVSALDAATFRTAIGAGTGAGTVTSVSWTGGIVSVATATTTPAFTIAGTSGGIPYFSSASTWASSAALAANAIVIGGGAGVAPATTTTGTGVVTAVGNAVNTTGGLVTQSGTLTASALLIGGGSGTAITSTTTGANVLTFLGTPSSANLASAVTDETGSGALVFATSPTLVTPVLGTPTSGTLSNCTVDGTDSVGFRNIPQNSQSAAYTLVLADAGKHIFHPSSDNNARTFTIPANSSVAYPIGTAITFINMAAANVTIAINTDTMYLSSAGTTGSRTLAQYGSATAIKITSTNWIISGSGLT